MRRVLLASLSIATACGGSPTTTPVQRDPAASIVAPPGSADDVVVAQVEGRPVWGSCVSAQVARGARDRQVALDECIAFELLAQAAEKRGLASDDTVVEALRTAMVNELIATEFEARYQKPEDLGATLEATLVKNEWRRHRPELRASTYVRALVPADAPPEVNARAKQIADDVVAELADEAGLTPSHLKEAMKRRLEGTGIELQTQDVSAVPTTASFEKSYLDSLFSIPEVGRIGTAVRTKRGWDVILYAGGLPPYEQTREQLAQDLFPELRRAQFSVWTTQLIKSAQITIAIDQGALALLDEAGR